MGFLSKGMSTLTQRFSMVLTFIGRTFVEKERTAKDEADKTFSDVLGRFLLW